FGDYVALQKEKRTSLGVNLNMALERFILLIISGISRYEPLLVLRFPHHEHSLWMNEETKQKLNVQHKKQSGWKVTS
ncbi:hypothetical protein CEXT_519021, partial [Caerostris extrusa]